MSNLTAVRRVKFDIHMPNLTVMDVIQAWLSCIWHICIKIDPLQSFSAFICPNCAFLFWHLCTYMSNLAVFGRFKHLTCHIWYSHAKFDNNERYTTLTRLGFTFLCQNRLCRIFSDSYMPKLAVIWVFFKLYMSKWIL